MGGRQVPQKASESFALISPVAFCSVYLQKKKERKKKEVSFNLGRGPPSMHLSDAIPVTSVFFLTTWPQGHSDICPIHMRILAPVCFLSYFTKLVDTSGIFKGNGR